jgi:uncharacterized protein (DUF488 family)
MVHGPQPADAPTDGTAVPGPAGVWTAGHGARPWSELAALLASQAIAEVWDVRSAPGSRRHPQFGQDRFPPAVRELGMVYRHVPALGGWRRSHYGSSDPEGAGYWHHPSFRGFAAYMAELPFRQALEELATASRGRRICLVCAETLPWRCHRFLIADALVLVEGVPVHHLISQSSILEHRPTPAAMVAHHQVVYRPLSGPPQGA